MDTFTPQVDVVGGSLALTAFIALLPILVFFILVGGLRLRSHWAAALALFVACFIATVAFKMPLDMVFASGTMGLTFGILPIGVIIISAVWLHRLTCASGREKDLTAIFAVVAGGDLRVQALLISLCFGGILEGLAGFGVPVAVVIALLLSLGFSPFRSAVIALVANTAPVGYAAMGTPLLTAGAMMDGVHKLDNARQAASYLILLEPAIGLVMPFIILWLIHPGRRGLLQLWPLALAMGISEALGEWATVKFLSFELAGFLPSMITFVVVWVMAAIYRPKPPARFRAPARPPLSPRRVTLAVLPYVLVIIVLATGREFAPLAKLLERTDITVDWPGLSGRLNLIDGEPSPAAQMILHTLSQPGVMIFACGLIITIVYHFAARGEQRRAVAKAARQGIIEDGDQAAAAGKAAPSFGISSAVIELGCTFNSLKWSLLTILLVMAMAYIMNHSGMILSMGTLLARTGQWFIFVSPAIGWLGTAISGSSTSTSALFAGLQYTTALQAGMTPAFAVAANIAGSVIGKLIAPQSLAIAAGAIGQPEEEVTLMRAVLVWALGLLIFITALAALLFYVFL